MTTTGRIICLGVFLWAGLAQHAAAFRAGDGKVDAQRDCYIGLEGYTQGDLSRTTENGTALGVVDTDCDPACDLDGASEPNGTCTFQVAACEARNRQGKHWRFSV